MIATVNLGLGIKWNEMIWIDDRNYPGGPIGFLFNEFGLPLSTAGSASYVVNNFLTDLMVVSTNTLYLELGVWSSLGWILFFNLIVKLHRAWVIWSYNYYVIAIPFLAIVTSTSASFIFEAKYTSSQSSLRLHFSPLCPHTRPICLTRCQPVDTHHLLFCRPLLVSFHIYQYSSHPSHRHPACHHSQ